MSEFKTKSITTRGMELLSKAISGDQLEFTRIEIGNGNFEGDIGSAESLVEVRQSLPINKIVRKGSQVTLSTSLKIEDITTPFEWTEIGVYARGEGNVEVLYMYGYTTNSSYISKDSLNEKLINVTVLVASTTQVTAVIDNSLVYLTAEALKEHESDTTTHKDIRDSVEKLKQDLSSIDISWEAIQGKPETFTPTSHNHSWGTITNKPTSFEPKEHTHTWSGIMDKPTSFPPTGHTHDDRYLTESQINNKLATVGKCKTRLQKSSIVANVASGVVLNLTSPKGGFVDIRGLSSSLGFAQIEVDGNIIMTKDSWLHEYMVVDVAGRGETPTPLILHYTKSLKITHYARSGNYTATINFHFVINEYV